MASVLGNEKENPPSKKRARMETHQPQETEIVVALRALDPVLQFLLRATGKPTIPVSTLRTTLPQQHVVLKHIPELAQRGVLSFVNENGTNVTELQNNAEVGFPPTPSMSDSAETQEVKRTIGTLHTCTKAGAKRRLAALKRSLKKTPLFTEEGYMEPAESASHGADTADQEPSSPQKQWSARPDGADGDHIIEKEPILEDENDAREALQKLLGFASPTTGASNERTRGQSDSMKYILPKQASYAGSNTKRNSCHGSLSRDVRAMIPPVLLESTLGGRRLYQHQAAAIESAARGIHTLVCTSTGSGKSLCYLLPVLAAAMRHERCSSILMFPTKALAQDQLSKLEALISSNTELQERIRPGVVDGDTPHSQRAHIAGSCNVILTNPDTLHAAILPGWKRVYRPLLERIKFIVIDEAHMYEGVFGAHVAMVLSRMMRLCAIASSSRCDTTDDSPDSDKLTLPTFLACSATMAHPEHMFRQLCPIARDAKVTVLSTDDDGSPRAAKHFFVWNPPVMDTNGMSTGRMTIAQSGKPMNSKTEAVSAEAQSSAKNRVAKDASSGMQLYRRHAADETALLLAKAVANKVRCIAFCKTRSLVEWVYERTVSALKADPTTEDLASRVESYRGGYTVEARRLIEQRLFSNELLGVVGTSALELGVDIGGIDITLHCGYPASNASLLQQAGRAGRGTARLNVPSLSITICFNSPSEQHIWRHPKNLLCSRSSIPSAVTMNVGLIEAHLLCAGEEYPLTGALPVTTLLSSSGNNTTDRAPIMTDFDLLGSKVLYCEALHVLASAGSLVKEIVPVARADPNKVSVYKTHPSIHKPWTRVSLRSIEPINYSIINASHQLQGGRMDTAYDKNAVLDTIPYSRVFYHAFPGAIIMHRGQKYIVHSMTRPPPVASSPGYGYRGTCTLAAFVKPSNARYSTRPLSSMKITVVKQLERIDSSGSQEGKAIDIPQDASEPNSGSLAGSGIVTVKRSVHGYKKLSAVTRVEFARTEISMPPMEFDTFALWIDTEATALADVVKDYDAGVHALSHALLAVAPLFVPCAISDLDCDHKTFGCTRVMLIDLRAGGSGTCAQLWPFVFKPNGLLDAAIDLLENCSSCSLDSGYGGGCPACLQSGQCLKFNQDLSRPAGLVIAKRVLERIKGLYKQNSKAPVAENRSLSDTSCCDSDDESRKTTPEDMSSPRRKARAAALRDAKHLKSARERQIIVGRPSWPLDETTKAQGRREEAG